MILIISKDESDASTNDVIDLLNHYKRKFIRLNGDDIYCTSGPLLTLNTKTKIILNKNILETNFNIAWFRRWSNQDYLKPLSEKVRNKNVYTSLYYNLTSDDNTMRNFLVSNLKVKKWLTNPLNSNVNKISVLKIAIDVGFKIPSTIITSSKKNVINLFKKHGALITKDISYPLIIFNEKYEFISKTTEIGINEINKIPNKFLPTLFQEKLKKEYEIRTFYLDGICYSMAIISQNDTKTKLDFRNYNIQNPNKNIPYKLPKLIERKIKNLMNSLNLNTGSIDIVKNTIGEYVFLEVNPVGQFGMTSFPCNYELEKKIAEYLIKNDNV